MPPRLSRQSISVAAPKNAKNKSKKRNLDAYAIAGHQTKERSRIAAHRLGESIDDNPRQKRRRVEEEDDASEDNSARRKLSKSKARGIDDEVEEGSDSEGNEWRLGGLADDDEDSDLDSEEAFGESDEEKFEGFTFRGSSSHKTSAKKNDVDLSEEDGSEDEEDDFGGEGVDLATMLDDEPEEMEEEDESEDDEGSEDSEDDEANDEERLARLRDRVEAMDKPDESTEAAEGGMLSVDDLLADLDPAAKKQYAAAIKTKKKSQAPKTLAAPLPKRQQDRLDREAASKQARDQISRWQDTVMNNRRAEFLSFPLKDPHQAVPIGKEKFDVHATPQNELEENIRKIMEESGMVSKPGEQAADEEGDLMKAEELATNKLPIEEVMRRRAELRRARDLLFREEIKAKRIAKIKSKSYRKVHRKQKEREAEKERAEKLGLMDEDEREKADRQRAEMRMSTKHRDSKWAKTLKATNRTVWDDGARDSVMEQARRQEELKRRIAGEDVSEEEGADSSSGDDGDEGEDEMVQRLKKLGDDGAGLGSQKGVGSMKFMRAAAERQRARNAEDVERLRKELAVADGDEGSDEGDESEGLGRAIFGPKGEKKEEPKVKRPALEEGDLSDDEEVTAVQESDSPQGASQDTEPAKSRGDAQKDSAATSKGRSKSSGPLSKGVPYDRRDPNATQKVDAPVSSWLVGDAGTKHSKKDRAQKRAADANEIVVNLVTTADAPPPGKSQNPEPRTTEDDADSDEDEANANPLLPTQSYHARAFAGDDVELAFSREKAALAAEEDEQEISTHLPGWGSWTGEGLSRSIRKANQKAAHNPLFKHKVPGGVTAEQRKDRKLDRVMVSEKQDRKGDRYRARELPRGFEAREQYERSLRVPVGPEWTTKAVFQRGTRPRVVVRKGEVIEAMERPRG
ncbi:U3 small nucleolar RNA-associated protein 14-like [Teratosphaeria destructans]|uniref:U3 small nucleolar RNA-associated protein 14-like n=1 Tax=Teratosphaeria destructans TaxID=418781 RepID=A0A9W7SJH0_9PEZI|nr:U3 small nucleolar RNA-associated protein 14-like [Teratosphaeria destructans]